MGRKDNMTQAATASFGASRIVLMICAAIAIASIGFAVVRNSAANDESNRAVASQPGMNVTTDVLEQRVSSNPDDSAAWQQLGAAHYAQGNFAAAAQDFEKSTKNRPMVAELWSSLGEARVMASEHDPMPATAVQAFEQAIALDAKDPRARYFLAVKKDLSGNHAGAIADWLQLLADTPPGAPWRDDLKRTIIQVGKINHIDTATRMAAASPTSAATPPAMPGIPGPTAKDMQAATAMSPSEQRQMAQGMVARLDARLKAQPADPDGWVMLMRSRMNLGETDKASSALRDAIMANPAQASMLRQQAGVLGIR